MCEVYARWCVLLLVLHVLFLRNVWENFFVSDLKLLEMHEIYTWLFLVCFVQEFSDDGTGIFDVIVDITWL